MNNELNFEVGSDDYAMIDGIARKRGISFEEAVNLLARSDLQRNSSSTIVVSSDVAQFRRGEH